MNTTMKLAAAFMVAAALTGCAKDPISSVRTENPSVTYDVLFNRHGCEVGRFYDQGRPVYTTICPNGGTSAADYSVTHSTGKATYTDYYRNQQVNSPYMVLQKIAP